MQSPTQRKQWGEIRMTQFDLTSEQAFAKLKKRSAAAASSASSLIVHYLARPGGDPADPSRIVFASNSVSEGETPDTAIADEEQAFQSHLRNFYDLSKSLATASEDALAAMPIPTANDALKLAHLLINRKMYEVAIELASRAPILVEADAPPEAFIRANYESNHLLFVIYTEQGNANFAEFYEVEYLRYSAILQAFSTAAAAIAKAKKRAASAAGSAAALARHYVTVSDKNSPPSPELENFNARLIAFADKANHAEQDAEHAGIPTAAEMLELARECLAHHQHSLAISLAAVAPYVVPLDAPIDYLWIQQETHALLARVYGEMLSDSPQADEHMALYLRYKAAFDVK